MENFSQPKVASAKSSSPVGSDAWLDEVFTYHPADAVQLVAYDAIRRDAKTLVKTITEFVPNCADKSAAIRKVRESVMTANAAVALRGLV